MLIVKMICLAIGTVLAVLFILLTMRGKKEDWRIEGVPSTEETYFMVHFDTGHGAVKKTSRRVAMKG